MRKGLVIADDLTGAAEIAGIAHRFGLGARIVCDGAVDFIRDITVIDTDTRSLDAPSARNKLHHLLSPLPFRDFDFIFKKTDSALRGPIRAEIETIMALSGKSSSLLIPNNPTRSRIIANGIYSIDGVPLHKTSFANDPQWPATTSHVAEQVGISKDSRITIPDSDSIEAIHRLAASCSDNTLPAGGADFFESLLRIQGLNPNHTTSIPLSTPALFVCGTTAPTARELADRADRISIPVCSVLEDHSDIANALRRFGCALLNINRPLDPLAAEHLESQIASIVATILGEHPIASLFIDGGATASAICRKLSWHTFDVVHELSPGVVTLQIAGRNLPIITIKPGSYRWPEEVLEYRFSISNGITQ